MAKFIEATFEIIIEGTAGEYTIQATGAENILVDPHPFSLNLAEEHRKTLTLIQTRLRPVSTEQLQDIGRTFYRAAFTPFIEQAFSSLQQNLREGHGARIRLVIRPQEFSGLPWELMHDGQQFLALRTNFPVVRGLSERQSTWSTAVRRPLKIIYAWAAPADLTELDLDSSAQSLGELLAENRNVQFDVLPHATKPDLQRALDQDPHIICFAGHGSPSEIYLEAETGSQAISVEDFQIILDGKNDTRLVFLAACETGGRVSDKLAGFAQTLAAETEIPGVVAMQYRILDDEANQLIARFFESLAAFRPVDAALAEARKAIVEENRDIRDVFAPVLYLQSESSNLFRPSRNRVAIGPGRATEPESGRRGISIG